jgi:hypothetical protein
VLARELAFAELREVPGQEAGPDRVRVSGGVDSQQAAIGDVSGERHHVHEELALLSPRVLDLW